MRSLLNIRMPIRLLALGVIDDDSQTTPFVDARATWTYNPGSYLQLGVVHTLNATDVLALNQESTAVWGLVNHRITPRLNGTLIGQFQHSSLQRRRLRRRLGSPLSAWRELRLRVESVSGLGSGI